MSFQQKIVTIMERPGQDVVDKDDVPRWMRYAGRSLGIVGSFIAVLFGVWNCVGIVLGDFSCLLSGMWQILAGFLVIFIEAPCCCMFLTFVQSLSDAVEKRPNWNRAAGYCGIALPPIFLCINLSSLLGSGLIFATGIIYGLMSLGKKASLSDMNTAAVDPQAPASNMQLNLVDNAQAISFTTKPNSNV